MDEENVQRNVERILTAEQTGSYACINQHLSQKRVGWYEQNRGLLNLVGSDPRKAYQMVLLEYMGLDSSEVPVVYEDATKITWRSYNWCPVLVACERLGIDTRKVCKLGWEDSVQAMIRLINPNLRFSRNYDILRPHGQFCEETIELIEKE